MKLEALFNRIYTPVSRLTGKIFASDEPLSFENRTSGKVIDASEGVKWAEKRFDCGWFFLEGVIPDGLDGKHLVLIIDVGGECCAYTKDGVPHKGFTNVKSEFTIALGKPAKTVLWDISRFRNGNKVEIWLDAGANDLFGNFIDGGKAKTLCIAVCDDEARKLYYDAEVMTLADAQYAKRFDELDENDIDGLIGLTKEFYSESGDGTKTVIAEGHAHIDLAWLWPVRETHRKALRTYSTLLYNSALYDEYVFGASQPQLMQWVKEDSPDIFEGLKKLHRENRFELQGMFWVESDTNLLSGESLIRQSVYGNRFWQTEFGETPEICWLPDTFGYVGQLPQIIRGCGGKYFLTTKLSWNDVNRFPYSSFIWKGIDGSEVLSHIPPEGNYNSAASPKSLGEIEKYPSNNQSPVSMMLFGIGDGGGGPGMEHLERLKREHSLHGYQTVKQGMAKDLFASLEEYKKGLPVWQGELYLEKHQGTYTTHTYVKQSNAFCERRLGVAEIFASLDVMRGKKHNKPELDRLWKQVLFLQFHDILPGSAISRVYDEAKEQYERIKNDIAEITPVGHALFNPTSFERTEYALRDGKAVKLTAMPFASAEVKEVEDKGVVSDKCSMENELVKVSFGYDGSIVSVFDKQNGCELLRDNGGYFRLYPDNANAWEVDTHKSEDARTFVLTELDCEEGAIGIMHMTYTLGENILKCDVTLAKDSKRLDFDIDLDLKDTKCCLRCDFPLNIASDTARCGIPFGSIDRPTHSRDSVAGAMKEVCCRYFVDISDGEVGAAVLGGDIFGYDIKRNIISINLVRNSTCPRDIPEMATDTGKHKLRFAFLPHGGDYRDGNVVKEAYLFANPILPELPFVESIASVSGDGAVIESIKPAENGDGIVLRVYESHGRECKSRLSLHPELAAKKLFFADMLENISGEADCEFNLAPFEIKTIIIK